MVYESPFPDIEIPDVPLHAFVFEHADRWPDAIAVIDGPSGRRLTYAALRRDVTTFAANLHDRGFVPGDVLAIYSPNLPEYAITFLGVSAAGGVNTTMNPLNTAPEVHRQLVDSGARFLVTTPPLLDTVRAAVPATAVETIFVVGDTDDAGSGTVDVTGDAGSGTVDVTPFGTMLAPRDAPPSVTIDPREDLVALPYSSGTTGLPKGVMLTHHNLVANLMQTAIAERLSADDILIGILPFYHIYGMVVVMSGALHAGATLVTMPRFDLEQFLHLIETHRVTRGYLVPPIVLALAKHPLVDRYDISSLRNVMSGAAPLPVTVAETAAARNRMTVRQGYGLTESSPVTHVNAEGQTIKIGSVGLAVPNTRWRLVDAERGTDVATGELGEVWVRGPQVMKGYLNNPAATAQMIDGDGWLRTGDLGRTDDDGYLYVVDRLKELIKYKGFQVAPAELEAIVQAHPAVADAAVVPSPDDEAGEVPKAFVVLKPGATATAEEIIAHVAARVAASKKVRRVEFIDAIPKVPSGKILRRQLVERERARRPEPPCAT